MAYNINVDLTALKEKNMRLKAIADSLESNIASVISAANNVNTGWTGANSDEYIAKFNEYKPQMDNKLSAIRATTAAIDSTIQSIIEAREKIRRGTNALFK